ncbi:TPA: restriction endonuclease subunit S [Campylobacter coli]|nr:restriction endonuclease subunit S [Campylobacter coli]
MNLNQTLQEKYPHLEVSVLKLSEVREDNESFRIDSEYFKKEYLENEKKLRNNKMLFEISNTYELHSNGAFKDIYNIIHDNNPKNIGYIESKNIGECFIDGEVDKISEVAHSLLPKTITKEGDILTARTGKIGGASYVFKEWENCNTNQNVVNIRLFDDTFSRVFVALFLNTKFGLLQFEKASTGNVQPWLNLTLLRKIKIPIFPMSFQLEIEKMVKDSHKALEESKELYKKAEETLYLELGLDPKNPLQSLLDSHTQDSTKPLNISIRTLKESFLQTGRLDSEYYQAKYEDIEKMIRSYKNGFCNLKDLVNDVSSGFAFSSDDYQDTGNLLLIRINNIKNATLDLDNVVYLKNEAYNLSPKDKIKKGDILISMSGSIGLSCVVRDDVSAMVNQRILKISIKNFNSDVLVLLLNSFICKMQFERIGTGGVQTNLSSIDMQNILIPKIDSTTQEKIAKYIQESFNLRKKSKQLLDNAKNKVEEQIQGKT